MDFVEIGVRCVLNVNNKTNNSRKTIEFDESKITGKELIYLFETSTICEGSDSDDIQRELFQFFEWSYDESEFIALIGDILNEMEIPYPNDDNKKFFKFRLITSSTIDVINIVLDINYDYDIVDDDE